MAAGSTRGHTLGQRLSPQLGVRPPGVQLQFIRPGKPVENAFIESFNSRFRDECLNQHWFRTLPEAQVCIERWRQRYNTARPHRGLGARTPAAFAALYQEGLTTTRLSA